MANTLSKIIDDIETKREIISTLPVNTKKNRASYVEKLKEIRDEYKEIQRKLLDEIQNEYEEATNEEVIGEDLEKQLNQLERLEKIKKIKDAMDNAKTPYAKMKLDKSIHNLKRFYRKNLDTVNNEIKKCIELFSQVGVVLTVKDFNFTPYVNQYMSKIFSELQKGNFDSNAINAEFEEIYWKCPDIITHIQLNIRYIFLKKEDCIARFFKDQACKTLNKIKVDSEEIDKEYNYLKQSYLDENKRQRKTIIDNFLNGYWSFKDYDDKSVNRSYAKFINIEKVDKNNEEVYNNLIKLLHNLYEYRNYLRFKYIFDDVKKIYSEEIGKDTYKSVKKQIIKQGVALSKAGKNVKDSYREKILTEIGELYDKLDDIQVREKIHECLNEKSTLKDMGNAILPFYRHIFMCVIDNNKDITEPEINVEIEEFEEYIRSPYNVISESVLMLQDKDIPLMIKDRYNLFDIKITKDSLIESNLENLIVDLEKIENSHYIKELGLQLGDIEALYRMKNIIAENE